MIFIGIVYTMILMIQIVLEKTEYTSSKAQGGVRNSMSQQLLQTRKMPEFKSVPSLSLVLPAYNEEQMIVQNVSDVLAVIPTWTRDFEVIAVNDGSTDGTGSLLKELCERDQHVRL